ncbi:MAG: leucine-rich repeat domain-containing protein, partial [Muribaculaceae bacterium]|nr:leucine-rich repeat domain-containing protein [Muribaculaceae bacterium]
MKVKKLHSFGRRIAASAAILFALPSFAYDFEVDGLYYDVVSFTDLTCRVVNNGSDNTYSGDIAIPDEVTYNNRRLKVTEIGGNAFQACGKLDNVIIGNNVTYIGESAFYQSSLEEITFGESVSIIDVAAFHGCTRLTKVNLNEALTSIGSDAFSSTTNLIEMALPEGLKTLGSDAFQSSGI